MANFFTISKIVVNKFGKFVLKSKKPHTNRVLSFKSNPIQSNFSPDVLSDVVKLKAARENLTQIISSTKLDKKTALKLYNYLPKQAQENFQELLSGAEKLGYITRNSDGSFTGQSLERFLSTLDKDTYDKIVTIEKNFNHFDSAYFKKILGLFDTSDDIIKNRENIEKCFLVKDDLYSYAVQLEKEAQKAAGVIKDKSGNIVGFEAGSAGEQIYSIFGVMPHVRGKSAESIYDKLMKKVLKKGIDIKNIDDAKGQITDLVGTRIVLDDISPSGIQKIVDNLCDAIEHGKINVQELSNYANGSKRYFTEKHFEQIRKSAARVHMKIENLETVKCLSESGYVTTQMNLRYANGALGELQIRGNLMMKYAEIEHIPYDIRMGKNISKNIPELEQLFAPVQDATTKLKRNGLNKLYDKYIRDCYNYIRKYELGEVPGDFKLPDLPKRLRDYSILSFENLEKIHNKAQNIKIKTNQVVKN